MKASTSRSIGKKARLALVGAASLLVAAPAAAALFFVYPPLTWPLGKSYSTHAADWWKWAVTQPEDRSPLLDETGEDCGQGQSGLTWYLAGSFDSVPVLRSCTIPSGRTLVFPVV